MCVNNRAVLAEVALRRGDLHSARRHLDACTWRLPRTPDPEGVPVLRAEARLARADGDWSRSHALACDGLEQAAGAGHRVWAIDLLELVALTSSRSRATSRGRPAHRGRGVPTGGHRVPPLAPGSRRARRAVAGRPDSARTAELSTRPRRRAGRSRSQKLSLMHAGDEAATAGPFPAGTALPRPSAGSFPWSPSA